MIKYIILSVIGYYIFTNYISPMIEGKNNQTNTPPNQAKEKKTYEDEYVDYEEVE